MNRRDVLAGAIGGAGLGVGGTLVWDRFKPACPPPRAKLSYAQQGEDLILKNILDAIGLTRPRYIDIGAYDPIFGNNTYLLYLSGGRGLLVEPNPAYAQRLKSVRPGDTVLTAGIGVTDATEADYYVMAADQLNTFSKEQADELQAKHRGRMLQRVIKLPLVNVNKALRENFPSGGPDLFSIDVEGLDYDILKTLDFERFRPAVFCVETSELGNGAVNEAVLELMRQKRYTLRGGTFVNSVFLDDKYSAKSKAKAS